MQCRDREECTMTKKFIIWGTAGAATILIAGGAAFVLSGSNHSPAPKPTAAAVSTPGATAAAVVTDASREEKSGWELEQEAKASYTLPDGTTVPIPVDQPLPGPVVSAIQAVGNPVAHAKQGSWNPSAGSVTAAVKPEEEKIHRKIVPVSYGWDGELGRDVWGVGGDASGSFPSFDDQAAAVAAAQGWVDANGGGSRYVVITFAG